MDPDIKEATQWYIANKDNPAINFTSSMMKMYGLKPKQVLHVFQIAEAKKPPAGHLPTEEIQCAISSRFGDGR